MLNAKFNLGFVLLIAGTMLSFGQSNQSAKEQETKLLAVLKSDASRKEKADACRDLARVASADAVPVLAGMLADEQLTHMARYALETIPSAAVDDAFRAALPKLKGAPLVGLAPDRTLIPCFYVDAVVQIPYGTLPTNMPGMYYVDIDHMKEYVSAAKDQSSLEEYYGKYIFGVKDFGGYLEKVGGKEKLRYLEDLEHLKVR